MNAHSTDHPRLIRRLRLLIALFIAGLVFSGVTAIPLEPEVRWLTQVTGAGQLVEAPASTAVPVWAEWLVKVETALHDINTRHPFIAYGGDWLAFGHFMIALVFMWAWRDPVRNRWIYDFGLLACALVIPFALIMGGVRGIPLWWRAIDCSFGVLGAVPLWLCRRWAGQLAAASNP